MFPRPSSTARWTGSYGHEREGFTADQPILQLPWQSHPSPLIPLPVRGEGDLRSNVRLQFLVKCHTRAIEASFVNIGGWGPHRHMATKGGRRRQVRSTGTGYTGGKRRKDRHYACSKRYFKERCGFLGRITSNRADVVLSALSPPDGNVMDTRTGWGKVKWEPGDLKCGSNSGTRGINHVKAT
jgi:hypothetical protein